MSADQLIQYLSWIIFILLFGITAVRALRQPRRAHIDIALLFSVPAAIIVISLLISLGFLRPGSILTAISTTLLLGLGYLLLRLADDFADVPTWLMSGAAIALFLFAISAFTLPPARPALLNLVMGLYLIGLLVYAAVIFVHTTRRTNGVTRRRMSAVAAGALLLALLFSIALLRPLVPTPYLDLWQIVQDTIGLASGVSFFLGFTPPAWLRRAWQEPELRAFLARAARLPRLPDTASIEAELEQGATTSLGASGARIGLWEPSQGVLRFSHGWSLRLDSGEQVPAARAFRDQLPVFADNVIRDYPAYAEMSRNIGVNALLVAPITAGEKRLGVLTVYAQRAPIFAEDDLALVQLLADQAAVILESRALIDEAARLYAREETTRLKEDFLSAAAHDLKTPLTTVVARAQYMERRALRDPAAPADLDSIRVLVREAQRLRRLVMELLDAARAEHGQLVGERARVDLVQLARAVCTRYGTSQHQCIVEADAPIIGEYDEVRIEQMLENLVENAVKYTPAGGTVRIKLWCAGQEALLSVNDEGIGIPSDDLSQIFERFYRAGNVDNRRFPGMGLGLFICRAIAEQHGGRIWATSQPGQGSTFHIALPYAPVLAEGHTA